MNKDIVGKKIRHKETKEICLITRIRENDNKLNAYFVPLNNDGKGEDNGIEMFIDINLLEEFYDLV